MRLFIIGAGVALALLNLAWGQSGGPERCGAFRRRPATRGGGRALRLPRGRLVLDLRPSGR